MTSKKDFIIAVLFIFCLTTSLFMIIKTSNTQVSREYDPWLDVNDDGKIDMKDIGYVIQLFGTSGTAINKTELLLELQARMDALNATVDSLEERVTDLEGQSALVAHAEILLDSTDGSGNVYVTYPEGRFTAVPSLSLTVWFGTGGIGQMGYVTVFGHTTNGFTLNVKDANGMNWVGNVQISYVAIQE